MHTRYMLDTNICIYITKQKPLSVLHRFETLTPGDICMSTITYGELFYGAEKSEHPQKTLRLLSELTELIAPLALPMDVGQYYGKLRASLEKLGKPIGNNDLWIAAHALASKLTLVTNNVSEFSRINHLKLENWASSAQ